MKTINFKYHNRVALQLSYLPAAVVLAVVVVTIIHLLGLKSGTFTYIISGFLVALLENVYCSNMVSLFLKKGFAQIDREFVKITYKNKTKIIDQKSIRVCRTEYLNLYNANFVEFILMYFDGEKTQKIKLFSERIKGFEKEECGLYQLCEAINSADEPGLKDTVPPAKKENENNKYKKYFTPGTSEWTRVFKWCIIIGFIAGVIAAFQIKL